MRRVGLYAIFAAVLAVAMGLECSMSAQSESSDRAALRRQIERQFDVLPLHNGLALRPKSGQRVRSIELTDGTIAVDGLPVTGAELREKLGADAELVLRLSYLDSEARQSLFGNDAAEPTRPPTPPPAAPEAPRTRRSDERVRFGGNITVGSDEIVNGDVQVPQMVNEGTDCERCRGPTVGQHDKHRSLLPSVLLISGRGTAERSVEEMGT